MRFSYNWLKELSGTKKSPQELIEMVIIKGFELEEQFNLSDVFKNLIVGEIIKIENHPNADKLKIVWVDLGDFGNKVQIVCGASNIEIGQKVSVALPGAVLSNNKIKIKKTEIRGVESSGMICAEDEIGLGKNHKGVMILNKNFKKGQFLSQALKLRDTVLDFDILPNRAHDCLSHQGLAREISAMEGSKNDLNFDLNFDFLKTGKILNIKIEDDKFCSRYMGAVLKNIKIKESPDWMKARLIASGMEPINNIVDITNYVMLETGSPLHAFDFNQISSNNKIDLEVRRAKKNEKLELLNEIDLELNQEDLVISNKKEALALAGIKGGKKSGINTKTNKIVLEAANFNLLNIRKSRQKHCLTTESQVRFEKGISPVLSQVSLIRAIELLKKHAEAELLEIVDCNKFKNKNQIIDFEIENVEKLLGKKIEKNEIIEILENLGFKILNKEDSKIKIRVPYWRLDIEDQADFIEEIARIKGYEKIKPEHLMTAVKPSKKNLQRELEWEIKDNLIALGFDEIVGYSFYGQRDIEIGKISENHFELENPNSEQQKLMRRTLIPTIIEAIKINQKNFNKFCLFEVGRVYFPEKRNSEEIRISGGYFDNEIKIEEIFFKTKEKLKTLFKKITNRETNFKTFQSNNNFYHPTRKAKILMKNETIGFLGEINPLILSKYKIKKPFIIFELNFEILFKNKIRKQEFKSIQKFPLVERDLSMFVDKKTEMNQVEKIIKKSGGRILLELKLFDIFEDQIDNKKSLAFHLKFGKNNETLKGEEVDKKIKEIIINLEKNKIKVRK